jgi:hypothetical protein
MLPRRFWEVDPRFLDIFSDTLRTKLQHTFGTSHFCQNKAFVILLDTELKGKPRCEVQLTVAFQTPFPKQPCSRR